MSFFLLAAWTILSVSLQAATPAPAAAATRLVDAAASDSNRRLLELAFSAVTAIPADPHQADRSKAQMEVVEECLAEGQLATAARFADRIDDWRRGLAYARLAEAIAPEGDSPEVRRYLALAAVTASNAEDWRPARIRMVIARANARLGAEDEVARLEALIGPEEAGKLGTVRAELGDASRFDAVRADLDAAIATRQMDPARWALEAYAAWHRRLYADAERRSSIEASIRGGWNAVPIPIQFDLILELADAALAAGDPEGARRLLADAAAYLTAHQWIIEERLRMSAEIASRRFGAGEADLARAMLAEAFADFRRDRLTIVDIERASVLRAFAEAQAAMGDRVALAATYGEALDEGFVNPNSRPRATDFSATCLSMTRTEFEPDAAMQERMDALRARLGDPW